MFYFTYETIIGKLTIIEINKFITNIFINKDFKKVKLKEINKNESKLISSSYGQILEYLQGKRKRFSIPIKTKGSDFQLKVWNELLKIPFGKTKSYKDIAINIANPKAYRAVGNAINKNPIPLLIPCHRIIKSDGSIGGFSSGINTKKKLLEIEDIL